MCLSVNCPNNHTGVGTDELCNCKAETREFKFEGEYSESHYVTVRVEATSEFEARKIIAERDFDMTECMKYEDCNDTGFSNLQLMK